MGNTHSKYQLSIFDFVTSGTGNGEIVAGAGTGKTYTGVETCNRIPRRGMVPPIITFLAFNKHIQMELARKLQEDVITKTYHSFGLAAINDRRLKITQFKNDDILSAKFGKELKPIFPIVSRLTGLFKGNLINEVTHQSVIEFIDHYGLELDDENSQYFDEIVEGTATCMNPEHIQRLGKIDFDDMIWYPIIAGLPIPLVDYLLVDEFQDSNEAQMELVIRAKNTHGRAFAIGDPNQAIYGWRGAGTKGMEIFAKRTNATVLPLSISYRCPRAVVANVNKKYPWIQFEAWEHAIEGEVNDVTEAQMFQRLVPGDMVLCRLNAPLVSPAMRLLRDGKKAIIKGRDIGKNLITLINQVERKFYPANLREFLTDLDDYSRKECEKFRATQRPTQADLLEDKVATLFAFAEGMDTVADIRNMIEKIFSDDQEGITFSSVHRSKGLEADNVFILNPELIPFKRARTEEAKKQELNLGYVSDTRAKITHNYVRA